MSAIIKSPVSEFTTPLNINQSAEHDDYVPFNNRSEVPRE